jgi:hypothetical protein
MADRVFPNNKDVDMGSKISFSGIDWSSVEQNMKNNKFAQSEESDALKKMLDELMGLSPEKRNKVVEELEEEADGAPEETEETEEPEANDHNNESMPEPHDEWKEAKTKNTMRKIAFTHPNQISAEAIEFAQKAGDQRLVNTILAARKENRIRMASVIQRNLEEATRYAQSDGLTSDDFTSDPLTNATPDMIKDMLKDPTIDADTKQKLQSLLPADDSAGTGDTTMPTQFTSASSFNKAQKTAFVNTALSLGMPIEYVNAMCPQQLSSKVASLNEKVKSVYASNLDETVKSEVITNMIKEAKLSPESKSEFVDYWNNILGYQDKAFWPSVAEDYSGAKGDK